MICNELPAMADIAELFDIFDAAAQGFRSAVENSDLHKIAEYQAVMWKLDVFLAERRFEA